MASINLQGDTSGSISISAPSVAGSNTLTLPATTQTLATQNALGVRNLIINGDMRIDQRNAGASVTIGATNTYTLDRFYIISSAASKVSVQQNAGSVTPPSGFKNYLGVTSLSAYSVGSGDYFGLVQSIEGYNISNLNFGSSGASTITLSFWVRSSLTGTFGGSLYSNNASPYRSYPFTYTINSANTWEQKTITIIGDTSGSWNSTNGDGLQVRFGLGTGTTYSGGTLNTWQNGNYVQPTSTTSVVGTSGATFYITGVQLEIGDTATPFEHRPYDMELARCQRYYEKSYNYAVVAGTASAYHGHQIGGSSTQGVSTTTGYIVGTSVFKVRKRTTPTVTLYDFAGNSGKVSYNTVGVTGGDNQTAIAENIGETAFQATRNTGGTATNSIGWQYTASSEL